MTETTDVLPGFQLALAFMWSIYACRQYRLLGLGPVPSLTHPHTHVTLLPQVVHSGIAFWDCWRADWQVVPLKVSFMSNSIPSG